MLSQPTPLAPTFPRQPFVSPGRGPGPEGAEGVTEEEGLLGPGFLVPGAEGKGLSGLPKPADWAIGVLSDTHWEPRIGDRVSAIYPNDYGTRPEIPFNLHSVSTSTETQLIGRRTVSVDPSESSQVGELLEQHRTQIRGWCRRSVGHEATAEDLTQEVLVRAFQRFDTLRDESRLIPWLRRITQRVCANWHARERETTEYVGHLESATREGTPEEAFLRAETQAEIREAVISLPADVQAAVRLFHLEGCTLNEVAARLELSPTTVKSRLQVGRQRLRKELAHMDTPARSQSMVGQRRQRLEGELVQLGSEESTAWRAMLERELAELALPGPNEETEILPAATVWLVEDPRREVTTAGDSISVAQEELRWQGFQARVVQKVGTLAERLRRETPDILVIGDEIPDLDTWALLRDLKIDRRTRSIAICILLTPGEDEEETKGQIFRAWQVGVDCCLTKPFFVLEFSQFIRRIDDAMKAHDLMILATDHAWRGDWENALACLRQAVRKGEDDTARKARDNPAFRPLHTDPGFRALVDLDQAPSENPPPPVAPAAVA